MKKFWLMKSEPNMFSIDHLEKEGKTLWEGVRNYQARNFMMKDMKIGDEVLFYHSNADPTGIAGLAIVSDTSRPDPSQFKKRSVYFDNKSTLQKPIWFCVEIKFVKKFASVYTLNEIKNQPILSEMLVVKRGQRLSIQPVDPKHFQWFKKSLV